MRFYYLDTALSGNLGHHASYCRMIVNELRKRKSVEVRVFGNRNVGKELQAELSVEPFFRVGTYDKTYAPRDPIAGWLRDFQSSWEFTFEDLERLPGVTSDDVVFFCSVFPSQYFSALKWFASIPASLRPRTFIELGSEPGLDIIGDLNGADRRFEICDPRRDPRATLYRFAATSFDPMIHSAVTLFTFDRFVSSVYQFLLGVPVQTLHWPHRSVTSNRDRSGNRPIVISFLGHQRPEKGYHLVPEIVQRLQDLPNSQFLIHNAAPQQLATIQEEVRLLAKTIPNIELDERMADGELWSKLLDQSDIIVCPYYPHRYASSHSAIMTECLANAIPAVVPVGTVMAKMAEEFGGTAIAFEDWDAKSVEKAIRIAVKQLNRLALNAKRASEIWAQTQGVDRLVDRLLGW